MRRNEKETGIVRTEAETGRVGQGKREPGETERAMKLDWEINECRVLKAKVGETTYFVFPGAVSLWTPSKQYIGFDGKVATVWPVEGGMSLTNAIAWCERDVERPEGCPAQPPAMDPVAPKTYGETSSSASKFPSTMDACDWLVGFVDANRKLVIKAGADRIMSPLLEWFDAALQRGYLQGVGEAEQKQGDREAAMRRFLALAPATREKFLEVAMAETPARTMTASQYLARQQMNAAPPSPEAAPPCPEDLIESFDARVWAGEFMRRNSGLPSPFISSHVQVDKDTMITWFSNALMRGYDERRNVEAPFDEQRRQIEDSRRELVRDYRDLVARCMARIAELSEART